MKLLALESSGMTASAAILEDDTIIAEYTVNYKKTHSQTLLPMVDEITRMTETDPESLNAIAVTEGPGSFTGIRIGAATAKGLGFALGKTLVGVPTVDAIACNLFDTPGYVCPMMDARRSQVYTGIYHFEDHLLKTDMEQVPMAVTELAERLNAAGGPVTLLGDGVPVYLDRLKELLTVPFAVAPPHMSRQRAGAVAVLAKQYFEAGKTVSAEEFRPRYLRLSQAERERKERIGGSDEKR